MGVRRNLVDELRNTNQPKKQGKKETTLSNFLNLRESLDVNKEVLEGNPHINSVLNSINLTDPRNRDRDENIYHRTQQDRLINDKRFRSASTESNFIEYRDKR